MTMKEKISWTTSLFYPWHRGKGMRGSSQRRLKKSLQSSRKKTVGCVWHHASTERTEFQEEEKAVITRPHFYSQSRSQASPLLLGSVLVISYQGFENSLLSFPQLCESGCLGTHCCGVRETLRNSCCLSEFR